SARALPPLDAPSLLRATAAGFRVSGSSGSGGACPVASWTICHASWLVSRGRFGFLLAREGMPPLSHGRTGRSNRARRADIQTSPLPCSAAAKPDPRPLPPMDAQDLPTNLEALIGPFNQVERKNAPVQVFYAGDAEILDAGPRVSIVGSREPSTR